MLAFNNCIKMHFDVFCYHDIYWLGPISRVFTCRVRLGSDLNLKVLLLGICLVVIIWGVVKRWLFGWLQVEIGSIQVREFHLPYHQVEIPISGNANCTKSPELNTWENDKNTFRPDINVKTLIITQNAPQYLKTYETFQ